MDFYRRMLLSSPLSRAELFGLWLMVLGLWLVVQENEQTFSPQRTPENARETKKREQQQQKQERV
jgi:hypothetical protein